LIEKQPEKPIQELLIAAAGPLVNVIIAGLLILITDLVGKMGLLDARGTVPGESLPPSLSTMIIWLLDANVTLVLFNLIPAFPLDGGRMLRAILAMFTSFPNATRIAATSGQVIAIILGIVGVLSGHFILALVAVFIFFGAGMEQSGITRTDVLNTRRVGDAYNTHVLTLTIGDRVSKVIDYILTSYQPDFAVLQGKTLLGIVTREDVLRALSETSCAMNVPDVYVTTIMERNVVPVDATLSLDEVRHIMAEKGVRVVAVYNGNTYLGLVSIEDIAEAFTVLSFIERYRENHELCK